MNTNSGATWIKKLAGVLGVAGASVLLQFPATAESVMPDSASESMPNAEVADTAAEPTIVEIAAGNESFSTLTAALEAAGLLETLSGEGPFTVFAPTNEAFAALPDGMLDYLLQPENQEALIEILTYHVVPGTVMSADLADGEVTTVQGSPATIDLSNGVRVGNANVVTADIPASNGVIHVIDTVMIPESMMAPAAAEEMQEMELPTLDPMMEEEMPMEMPSGSMEMLEEGMPEGSR